MMARLCGSVNSSFALLCFVVVATVLSEHVVYGCPMNCRCLMAQKSEKGNKSEPVSPPQGKRVLCINHNPPIYNITSIVSSLPKRTVVLNLSGNKVMVLLTNAFQDLTSLTNLNLSGNPISVIQPNAFNGLGNLEKLDLSGMKLESLNVSMFEGLTRLKRLYLFATSIQKIQSGTFDALSALTWLGLQTDLLVCDCHLQWMISWRGNWNGHLNDSAFCAIPSGLKGKSLTELTEDDLVCVADSPLELPVFDLAPSMSQIVFSGDKLPFQCRASLVDHDMKMSWLHNDDPITSDRTLGIFIHDETLPGQQLSTTLVLERLAVGHSGTWKCRVESARGSVTKLVNISVLAENASYCPRVVTETSRGMYTWPETLAGIVRTLPCDVVPAAGVPFGQKAVARHTCHGRGVWMRLDVSRCSFISSKTRKLEAIYQFSLVNGSCQANCVEQILMQITGSGQALGNTDDGTNVDDVIILSHIINTFSKNVRNVEVLRSLVNLSSSVMELNSSLLVAAQSIGQACSRIVKALEYMTEQLLHTVPNVDLHSKNIAIQALKIQPYLFAGINCSSWIGSNQTVLFCFTNANGKFTDRGQFNASIVIPTDVMTQIQCASSVCPQNDTIRIQAIMYRNANLFPVDETASSFQVTSAVVASRIAGVRIVNSSSPITVSVWSPKIGRSKMPVHWGFSAGETDGAWLSTGCALTGDASLPVVTFKCNHLTNFAIAEGRLPPQTGLEAYLSSFSKTSAIIYLGSAVLIVCLSIVFVVYIVHRRNLQMSRKMRHAIANLCLCVVLLCVVYMFGICLYNFPVPCRVAGIVLHYLSLCALFWITAVTFKILHHLSKQLMTQPPPEELSGEPSKPKPIIAGYLLGWGVAVIICGISGAINWTNYEQSQKYCFLPKDAALTTVFVPAGILGCVNIVLFLRIFCLIQRIPSSTATSETIKISDDPGLEDSHDNEIRLISSNQTTTNSATDTTHGSNRSNSPLASSRPRPADEAYGAGSQLCAVVLALVLYCSTWLAGAFAVTQPIESALPYHGVLFQCLYAVLASAFGAFMLVFYCIGRKDFRQSCCSHWSLFNKWKYVPANGNVVSKSPAAEDPPAGEVPLDVETVSLANRSVNSGCGGDGSKASSDVVVPPAQPSVGLEPSFTAVVDSSMFYNPHQNGIAKKYWERSKKRRAVQVRKEIMADLMVDDIELLRPQNGHVVKGRGVGGPIPSGFGANLEIEVGQTNISGNDKFPATKTDNSFSHDKPPLPITLQLLSQDLHADNETVEKSAAVTSKRHSDLEGVTSISGEKDFKNLRNGVKPGRLPTEGTFNSGRTCDGFHEPVENGFLEQLELRIPQPTTQTREPPQNSAFPPAKSKIAGSVQNVNASRDQKVVSDLLNNDLNGNKDSNSLGAKRTEALNCELASKKVVPAVSSCSPGKTASKSPLGASNLSEAGAHDVWEEQQNIDIKVETSV